MTKQEQQPLHWIVHVQGSRECLVRYQEGRLVEPGKIMNDLHIVELKKEATDFQIIAILSGRNVE